MATKEIISLMEEFISGSDTSIQLANRLEVLMDDAFPDDDFLQETVEVLACYRPEGGTDVLGVQAIQSRVVETRNYLRKKPQA